MIKCAHKNKICAHPYYFLVQTVVLSTPPDVVVVVDGMPMLHEINGGEEVNEQPGEVEVLVYEDPVVTVTVSVQLTLVDPELFE